MSAEISKQVMKAQIGLMLFKDYNQEGHLIPAVLCIDRSRTEHAISLFISEGTEEELHLEYLFQEGGLIETIKSLFPQVSLFIKISGRQLDMQSCTTDALSYLITANQFDMINEACITTMTVQTK